jgi:hypothetical protein
MTVFPLIATKDPSGQSLLLEAGDSKDPQSIINTGYTYMV